MCARVSVGDDLISERTRFLAHPEKSEKSGSCDLAPFQTKKMAALLQHEFHYVYMPALMPGYRTIPWDGVRYCMKKYCKVEISWLWLTL